MFRPILISTISLLRCTAWFGQTTNNNGVMTEAYYPRLDAPNTQSLQLVVCTATECQTKADDMGHEIRVLDTRAFVSSDKYGQERCIYNHENLRHRIATLQPL